VPIGKDAIKITGLKELQKSLKQMDGESQKKLRLIFNKAMDIVITEARPNVPRLTGKLVSTLKARSGQRDARIAFGGRKAPYAGFAEFGGAVGRNKSVKRPFIKSGRSLYPAFKRRYPQVIEAAQEGLADLAKESGLEVS